MVSYSGAFTMDFRQYLERLWNENTERIKIVHTPVIRMNKVLGNDVKIKIWNVSGLPNNDLSVENGIIMFEFQRWPLIIDLQTQAKKFIKTIGKDREPPLEAFKPSEQKIYKAWAWNLVWKMDFIWERWRRTRPSTWTYTASTENKVRIWIYNLD